MHATYLRNLIVRVVAIGSALALALVLLSASGSSSLGTTAAAASQAKMKMSTRPDPCCHTASQLALYSAMRNLWSQHMEWTYATVAAFAVSSPGLTDTLNRLLQNQVDIGNAIKPYYGDAAGNQLTALLKTHILDYVPILKDAKAGNQTALQADVNAVLANGVTIGKFLETANPKNWPAPEMEQMMTTHNEQTLKYATDQLQGNYAASISDYGLAETHMYQMGDMLTNGIIAQFPAKFNR